jgi:hypothetical protein
MTNMTTTLTKESVVKSLRVFKSRRDALLHEDSNAFTHHLDRFVQFLANDQLSQRVLGQIDHLGIDHEEWLKNTLGHGEKLDFPDNPDEELFLRYEFIKAVQKNENIIFQFGFHRGARNKKDDNIEILRTLIIRPFVEEFGDRLGEVANLASPEARELQAVPLSRIPSPNEAKIFLSHKTIDKPLVYRYFTALKEVGFDPWLDESEMPAGSNVERSIFDGFENSCAAVFFITENFVDERYLAAEVDYAIRQKRHKDKKFSIITLRYSDAAPVPGLLTPYVYRDINNDLQGFYEIIRALPIEMGPTRWKEKTVEG